MAAKFYLMTDSPCDFTQRQVDDAGIGMMHFTYTEQGKPDGGLSGVDDLFVSRSSHEFYEAIRHGAAPMTSQPSQMEFEKKFYECAKMDVPTVYLAFTSALSGCYEGALMALERVKEELGRPDLPIHIVDTKLPSTAQYVLIAEAIRQRDRGLTAEQMVAWAEEDRYFVNVLFMVEDLDALHRGGRVPKGVAVVGGALDVKPLLSIDLDGGLSVVGITRGRKKGIRKLAQYFLDKHNEDAFSNVVAVGNADCPKDAARVVDLIHKTDDTVLPMISTLGPTIGCHVGPGMLSCCFWGADRRDGVSVSDRIASGVRGE